MTSGPFDVSDDTPVYVISVAAELSGMHPQTLRSYDRLGLVSPGRSSGRGRRYSLRDILVLRQVQRLSQVDGVNLSGIKLILELEADLEQSRQVIADMNAQLTQLRAELESTRAVAARLAGLVRNRAAGAELVPVRNLGGAAPRAASAEATAADPQAIPSTDNNPAFTESSLWKTNSPGEAGRRSPTRSGRPPPRATPTWTPCTCSPP